MDLSNLSPRQLDHLERAARAELERRQQRRPKAEVIRLLRAGAAEAGYSLAAVFPELLGTPTGRRGQSGPQRVRRKRAALPSDASIPEQSERAPLDGAQRLVRSLAAAGSRAVGLSQSIEAVRAMMDLAHDWPAFHAALELAAKRNWVHFRGNDQCTLTEEGLEAAR